MAITDRIQKLKPYLAVYNISVEDGVQYAVLRTPEKWTFPVADIEKAYDVKVNKMEGGAVGFFSDISSGADALFDAVEYAINLNVEMEERLSLLREKIEDLKKLFMTESLSKLKRIDFVFKAEKKTSLAGGKKKTAPVQEIVEQPVEGETTEPDTPIVEEPETEEDNGLMDFVEKSIE